MNILRNAGVLVTLFVIVAVAILLVSFCTAPQLTEPPRAGRSSGQAPILDEGRGE